jgi:MscS family membrane protein
LAAARPSRQKKLVGRDSVACNPVAMRVSFKTWFNGLLLLLAALLCWSVWQSAAQTNTAATNNPAQTTGTPPSLQEIKSAIAEVIPDNSNVTPDWVNDLAADFPFLKREFLGNELWKWLTSLVYIFLALYVAKFLDYLTRFWLKKRADKTGAKVDPLAFDLLDGPVKMVVFIIFLHIGLDVLRWPPKVQAILAKGFTVVVALSITYALLKLVDLLMAVWRSRSQAGSDHALNEHLFPIMSKTVKACVMIVALLVTADNLDIKVTAALTSLSIGGLVVGLAAQDTLSNLFGAVAVFMDKPFRIGDHIQMDTVDGTVETIGVRSTRVRNGQGYLVTIPNKTVGNATIINISRRPNIQGDISIALTYDTTTEKLKRAIAILKEVFAGEPLIQGLLVTFDRFKESALNVHVTFTWNGVDDAKYAAGMHGLNMQVKQRFEAEAIQLAAPARTVYLKQDSEWRVTSGDESVGRGLG